ncbi:hypothetical protein HBH80_182090 [Parastagonospora nodorum]|nr:hypothetical protein HBH80_182090 [Parastagonospora nodorum]
MLNIYNLRILCYNRIYYCYLFLENNSPLYSQLCNLIDKLTANKLPCLAPIALLKLLKKILLIAIRIYYCITLCYLVYKHSCLLAYCSLIYIRIISRDKVAKERIYLNIY